MSYRVTKGDCHKDTKQGGWRYPEALREAATADADESAKKWLSLATGLDYSARVLMQFALRSASHSAASQAEPWVELALQAGAGDGAERTVVRFILGRDETGSAHEDKKRAALKAKLSRLESFANLATTFAGELRAQLNSDDAGPE